MILETIVSIIIMALATLFYFSMPKKEEIELEINSNDGDLNEKQTVPSKKPKKAAEKKPRENKEKFAHKWLQTTLKGHSGQISCLDINGSGKYLVSSADDRSIFFWSFKTFNQKEHKSVRANVEFDYCTQVKWSPDSKAIVANLYNENAVRVFRVGRKDDGFLGNIEPILTFPKVHETEIISIGIACNGKFIMTCSSDTSLIIWDLKGEILSRINTLHINNHYAAVSSCGRFVASSGFSPEVKVWEVNFNKSGDFQDVTRAFELKGHTSGVYKFCFSSDSSRMASISKDRSWKLWDTNIEYKKQQEASLIQSGSVEASAGSALGLSPDGRTVVVGLGSSLHIFSGNTGLRVALLENIFTVPISSILFSPLSLQMLVAGGKHIHIFHNVQGHKNTIEDLELRKRDATNASMKARLQSQIDEAKAALKLMDPNEC